MLEKRNHMNEAEEQERECRRHANEGWNCERVSRECFPVAEPYADPPSPFTEAWLAKCRAELEEQDARLVAWIERMRGQICCGGTSDELGYCPHGPHRTGTKCPLIFWMDVHLARGDYLPQQTKGSVNVARNEFSGIESEDRERDPVESVRAADRPGSGEVD